MLSLIPTPKSATEKEGVFRIEEPLTVTSAFDLPLLSACTVPSENGVLHILKDETVAPEGYRLSVRTDGITVCASEKIGAYYALQSVRRLAKYDAGGREVPCCEIDDAPRYRWRGLNIDVSRHFFTVEDIKRRLDAMFEDKLNVLHWHLTDDQGWRIEIKKYPLLTQIGSKRAYTQTGGWESFQCEHQPYGGFYTQEEIKDVVAYAKERGITVVPEIDFPAHCASAMAAYPYLACFPKETEVPGYFGGLIPQWKHFDKRWNRTVCCGKESSFEFIFGVLDEVCDLFDAPYIHMGGDEAPKGEWKRCPECQRVIKDNHLKNETELQGWFENRIIEYLQKKGKTLIGWNEVIRAENLNTHHNSVVIQYWTRKRDAMAEAYANSGGATILSNHQSFYFDMPYAMYPVQKTYEYRPEDYGVDEKKANNILGIEGELWSEWIPDVEKLEMLSYPRMQALSEVAWSPAENRDFESFMKRFNDLKSSLNAKGIHYACDTVSLAKDSAQSARIVKKFRRGNPYLEVEINQNLKAKGDN